MKSAGLIVAVLFAAVSSAAVAADQDAVSGLRACKAETDQAARLACFDRLAARFDTAAPVAQTAPATAQTPAAPTAAPPASVAQAAPPNFGGENLNAHDDTPRPEESMTATVAKASFNAIGHFTIVLDNGQVWRQLDADTATARLRGSESVKITKGFLDSYSLEIAGNWGSYKVKRVK